MADELLRHDDRRLDVRLLDLLDLARHLGRVVHLDPLAHARLHAVRDGGRRHEQVEIELALEPLAHDLHVQEAEEAAAEPEAERLRRLRLVEERGVVQLQPLERVAQLGVRVRVGREEPGEHHRLDLLVAHHRLLGGTALGRDRVADAQLGDVLEAGDDIADLAGGERVRGQQRGREEAELLRLEARAERHRAQRLARRERAVDDAHERDDAAVLVVRGVEDERARRRIGVARRRGNALDDRVEDVLDALPGLRRDAQHAVGVDAEQVGELRRDAVGVGLRQVDLVDDRHDLEVVLDREVRVGERLRLDPLRGVDDEQRALAGLQRARDLVGEVDVARRVDQVELVTLPGDAHRLRLDRDAALALEVHRVEHLRAHVAARDGVRELENAVGERRLAVVDVRDDREVADAVLGHG